jgi:O-acetyl-ADP-ribose deacetylase (regulator of RNase III)
VSSEPTGESGPLIKARLADITKLDVDAIVNAANSRLMGGGGVDGAIHRAAGTGLARACASLGGCEPGDAKVTPGFALPARWIIHTVGPIWQGGRHGEDETLASCYRRCLEQADTLNIRSVAFPSISTGAYGFPGERAARIAVSTIRSTPTRVGLVMLVDIDRYTLDHLRAALGT